MTQLPIPVHVRSEPPAWWDDIEARQREFGEEASPWLQKKRRPTVASATLDWGALGFEPRWAGFDTADCVAALQPSIFSGRRGRRVQSLPPGCREPRRAGPRHQSRGPAGRR